KSINTIVKQYIKTGVNYLAEFKKDTSDRNRTSPFAFTGNKFEFRMVGSSQSIGLANAVLNSAVSDVLRQYADTLEKAEDKNVCSLQLIADTYRAHKKIIFNGNNYSKEWAVEAEKRGLVNIDCMVDAIPAFTKTKNVDLFVRTGVFSAEECQSRYEIMMDNYAKTINIEASVFEQMLFRSILPAATLYLGKISEAYSNAKTAGFAPVSTRLSIKKLAACIDNTAKIADEFETAYKAILNVDKQNSTELAQSYHKLAVGEMAYLREAVDELETLTAENVWPMPNYNALLFDL
ncbi:MAG: glutamine synthetase type III, partial [Oscillospiraceae bacterium]